MREILENEKKINQWIDLIFGVEQKETESHQVYFEKQSYINYENNSDLYNDPLSLQSVDFGLIPFQLFYEKFPNSFNYMQYFYQLKSENINRFENEHKSDHDPRQCFIYRGRNFLSPKYLEIIKDINSSNYNVSTDEEKAQNLNNDFEKIKYDFIGDVFGFVTIISRRNPNLKSNKDKNNNTNNNMRKTVNNASKKLKDNVIDEKVQKKYKSVSAYLFIKNPNEENCKNFQKYKFLNDMRDILENEKKINQWIDLIFGVEQKETESHQVYFEKQSHINYENNSDLYNDPLSLQSVDFGLIPFQLFYEKFLN